MIASVGTEPVIVVSVSVDPDVLVNGGRDISGVELEPGEDFTLVVAIALGTRFPLEVTMRWRDSRGEQERTQKITFS